MATVETPQDQLLRDAEEQLLRIDEEAKRLAGSLSARQLHWAPPDGGWSIAQVFVHLATANGSYLGPLAQAIERDRASGRPSDGRPWRPTLFGGMLIRSLEPSARRRMPSPKIWRPDADQPTGALEAFLTCQANILELVRSARGIDLVRARLASPVSRLIRMNVGDVIRVLVVHDWRHLGQVQRVLDREAFPEE